jgi:hypothetical protein
MINNDKLITENNQLCNFNQHKDGNANSRSCGIFANIAVCFLYFFGLENQYSGKQNNRSPHVCVSKSVNKQTNDEMSIADISRILITFMFSLLI